MIRRIGKRHPTERFRAPNLLVERWSNAKAAWVGYFTGKGMTSTQIERAMKDHRTSAATVRRMWKLWDLPTDTAGGRRKAAVPVVLTAQERERLFKRAEQANLDPEEWARQVLVCAIDDDMYVSITDGRFQN